MFQLEHELQQWAARFSRMEVMRRSDIEELEQHVRDSIADLTTKGLSEEEAFLIATMRVGEPFSVGKEFGKVNGGHVWGHRVFWMLAGYLFFEVCRLSIAAVAGLTQVLAALAGSSGTVMAYSSITMMAICWLGLAIGIYRWSANPCDGRSRGKFFGKAGGKAIGIGAALIVVMAIVMKFGSQIIVARLTSFNDIGQAAFISAWANALFALLIPLAFLVVMATIRVRMRDAVAAEP